MGGSAINLLVVEDSANDAMLLLAELKRHGQAVEHHRVETRQDYLAALRNNSWDAVISDYVLPQFSGPQALHLLRQQDLDTPFIMVSGIYGETEAVEMMKAGADDYIMKGSLSRLAPALQRELEAAQARRARKRAEGAMQFLASIVESSADAVFGLNLDSLIVSWNPAAEILFGYNTEEIVGRSTALLYPPHRREEMIEILAGVRRGDIMGLLDTERLHKNGSIIPMAVTVSPIKTNNGEIVGASSIARDISRQKQVEAERQLLMEELMVSAREVRTLSGLLPICASCKRIRDDNGYWQQVEAYLAKHSEVTFSHSLCPDCASAYEPKLEIKKK